MKRTKREKRKKVDSKAGLSSPEVKGQGTTNSETGSMSISSARQKRNSVVKCRY
ncbi:YuzL family protein [Cytobacillus purgationiresistens]|uniref:YuzL family protein n=1 Tax=Cytobacillus purgationiresistens TaxID=863449 RepID=UPI0027D8C44A|nr:YuzL family protein [Cytobacillus purgationiresistens]